MAEAMPRECLQGSCRMDTSGTEPAVCNPGREFGAIPSFPGRFVTHPAATLEWERREPCRHSQIILL